MVLTFDPSYQTDSLSGSRPWLMSWVETSSHQDICLIHGGRYGSLSLSRTQAFKMFITAHGVLLEELAFSSLAAVSEKKKAHLCLNGLLTCCLNSPWMKAPFCWLRCGSEQRLQTKRRWGSDTSPPCLTCRKVLQNSSCFSQFSSLWNFLPL